jgi:CO dehydrogenase maturation factor
MKIAIAGKGGVGKTVIAGGLAWSLARAGYTTIAIDADPTPNLALTLGIPLQEANAILPVSENTALINAKTGTGYPGIYALNFTVNDIVKKISVPTPAGVNLLVMGTVRSMDSGCSCAANSVIRSLVRHLVVERDEAVVLDMEAGLEHLGRGTAEGVDCMLVVSDTNAKSLDTAGKIARMARDFGISGIMIAGNRVQTEGEEKIIRKYAQEHDLPVAGNVPFDPAVAKAGISGSSILALKGSPALVAIDRIGQTIRDSCHNEKPAQKK